MKQRIIIIFLLFSLSAIAQNKFEKGYYIDNQGVKIKGFINNEDWLNNPKSFKFKSNLTSKTLLKNIESIREFGIHGKIKYVKVTVNIDRSSSKVGKLSSLRTSEFKEEKLLLKVLVEGSANLYSYTENDLNRYFYKKDESIKPLEYKLYITSSGSIAKNRNYLFELKNKLTCKNLSSKGVNYTKSSLVKYFISYNNCKGNNNLIDYTLGTKGDFNIYGKIGGSISSLKIYNELSKINIDFSSKTSFRLGVEFEYIFGFNNNKWALLVEPTYQKYAAEKEFYPGLNVVILQKATIDYSSIEIPIGLRYYMFFNNKNKVFLNSGILFDLPLSGEYGRKRTDGSPVEPFSKISSVASTIFIGTGYTFNNKYRIELRYNLDRDLLNDFVFWKADYSNFLINLSYNLFD